MSNLNIDELIQQSESVTLEFKAVIPPPPIVARIISAFANSKGGTIICGINDDGTVKGIEIDVPAFQTIESALSRLDPRPTVDHYLAKVNEFNVYVIEVKKSSTPILTEGKAIYKRINEKVVIAPPTYAERVIQGRNRQLKQLSNIIETAKTKSTLSKVRFLEQYTNLVRLLNRSSSILFPESITIPPEASEGKALVRLTLSSFADTFEGYLADLLFEIYLAKPETLKSNSPITTLDVLNCQTVEEIVRLIATRKISSLKKGNVTEFIEENKQIKGLNAFTPDLVKQIDEIFQTRHLYVHNNGCIDAKYLSNSSRKYKLGDELLLSVKELCDFAELFIGVVNALDKIAITTYSLSTSD